MPDIVFRDPGFLWLLALLLFLIGGYVLYQAKWSASVRLSSIDRLQGAPISWKYYLRHLPAVLRFLTIALIIVALARPQSSGKLDQQRSRRDRHSHLYGHFR